nr:MAG TPA: major tail protein [Caudoviricetes sp.]
MAKFTQIPTDTFKKLQLGAGLLATEFDPATGEVDKANIVGATSGGVSFEATPSFSDFGEDIDNCPKNTKELKKLDSWEAKMSGSFVTMDTKAAVSVIGTAAVASNDPTKVVPRNSVDAEDFKNLWWVGDYSDVNDDGSSAGKAGFIAIKLINALSTGGFKIQSGDKAKGTFEFEYTGHYSIENTDIVPFELYIKAGSADA